MLKTLEIESNLKPIRVNYSLKTKRVSVAWQLAITNPDSIASFSVIVRPDDKRKSARILKWIKSIPDVVATAKARLQVSENKSI
jgi:hypothetical protein